MRMNTLYRTLAIVALIALIAPIAMAKPGTRKPVAMGRWYPQEPQALHELVSTHLNEAEVIDPTRHYVACVLPSGPYEACANALALATKQLQPGTYDRVIVLAPSHFATFRGCAVPSSKAYLTPLGTVPIDGPAIRTLQFSSLFSYRTVNIRNKKVPIDKIEYAIEVVLPFLQAQLGEFKLVPILVGGFIDQRDELDTYALQSVADKIKEIMDDRTLIVVPTGLTHFGPQHGFTPATETPQLTVESLDTEVIRILSTGDRARFQKYLDDTKNPIDGRLALDLMLRLLPKGAQGGLMDYARPELDDEAGAAQNSVSYASIAYWLPKE